MRKFGVVLFTVLLALSVCGAEKSLVPIVHVEQEEALPAVEASGSWKVTPAPGFSNRSGTPPGVLASRLGTAKHLIQWKPSQFSRTGTADLTDAVLSEDESLLILAERIGGVNKNNSTRLVFVNLFNGKITGGFELPQRRITKLAVIPGRSGALLAAQEAQSAFHSPDAVLELDLANGTVSREFPAENAIVSLAANQDAVWYTMKGSRSLMRIAWDGSRRMLRSRAEEPLVSASYNGKNIFVCGKGTAELYESAGQSPLLESWPLPDDLIPEWCCTASEDGRLQVLGRSGKTAYLLASGTLLPLAGRAGGGAAFFAGKNQILLQLMVRGSLQFYSLPEGAAIGRPTDANSLRPTDRNGIFRFFARSGDESGFVLIDTRANVFQVRISERMRWNKKLLLRTDPTGIQGGY